MLETLLPAVAGGLASAVPQALGGGTKVKVTTSQLSNISFNPAINVVTQSPIPSLGYSVSNPQYPSITQPVSDIEKTPTPEPLFGFGGYEKRDISGQFPEGKGEGVAEAGMFAGISPNMLLIGGGLILLLLLMR